MTTKKPIDVNKINLSKLPTIEDEYDIREFPDGKLFLAKFLHDPTGDTMWHVKQIMPELLAGKIIRHGLSVKYWSEQAHLRPPIAQKKGKGYLLLELEPTQ